MQLPAPRILNNKIAGACTTLLHNHLEWQFHPRPNIQLNHQILIMVVVRTITNHVPNSFFRKWEVSNSLAVPVAGTYDPQDPYVDNRQYQDTNYSQAPLSTASSATATSGSQTSGTRDRGERERTDRERHHGRSRR